MKNFTKRASGVLAVALSVLFAISANAQCTVVSSDNYSVRISVQQIQAVLSTRTSCGNGSGYNYNIEYNYNITFSGTNTPTISTIQGVFSCGNGQTLYFPLPVGGGSGTAVTGANPFRNASDCATANLTSLGCTSPTFSLTISGKGINTVDPNGYGTANVACALFTSSPLPVKLTSFDAAINQNKVALVWTTASETDNAYFILERSGDAKEWEAITQMNGNGTAHVNNTYNYTDDLPQAGTNYYRLKQVDMNGTAAYSKILAVEAANTDKTIAIFPNPNNGENLHFTGLQTAAEWSMKVLNTTSSVVYQTASLSENISLPGLPSGMYYVQLHNDKTGKTEVVKLMKK